jgi:tight adherence protein B
VNAITAEAKWSGKFLSAFPIVSLIVIKLGDPNYYDEVMTHPLFVPGCIAVVVFLSANLLVMRKLTDIKV